MINSLLGRGAFNEELFPHTLPVIDIQPNKFIIKPTFMKSIKGGKIQEDVDRKEHSTDDVTRKKIKKHLSDIHDVITDEDIKNVVVPGAKKEKKITKEDQPKKPGEKEDTSLASWNILED